MSCGLSSLWTAAHSAGCSLGAPSRAEGIALLPVRRGQVTVRALARVAGLAQLPGCGPAATGLAVTKSVHLLPAHSLTAFAAGSLAGLLAALAW
jgi:hypothetical protein